MLTDTCKNQYYTYAHYDDVGAIFYIGKGKDSRAYSHSDRNRYWKNVVSKRGLKIEILSIWGSENEALQHEVFLIKCFKELGYKLCNLTEGGEGASGAVRSPETRAKMSASQTGKTRPHLKGKPLSEEHKRKLSEIRKRRCCLEETRQKLSLRNKGSNNPNYGKVTSDEVRAKISNSKKGKPMSEEHRLHMIEALRLRAKLKSSKTEV